MSEVICLQQHDSAQLLFRFCEWPVGYYDTAVSMPQTSRRKTVLERLPAKEIPSYAKQIVKSEALLDKRLPLAFGHFVPQLLLMVSEANVLHRLTIANPDRRR